MLLKTGLTRKVSLFRKMVTTRLKDCKSMEQYDIQIVTAAHQLTGIGLKMDEEWRHHSVNGTSKSILANDNGY